MMNPGAIFAELLLAVTMQSSTAVEQVSEPGADIDQVHITHDANARKPSASGSSVDNIKQLSSNKGGPPEARQLTNEKSGGAVTQLGQRDRNMRASPDLSDRMSGFQTTVMKIEGTDRCSAELLSAKDRDYCQRVIENRSAEYSGPQEVPLTPEQKLLAERNFKLIDHGAEGAIKRLATGKNSAEDSDNQAIASVVLGSQEASTQPAQDQPAESNLSAETQALLEAIIKNVSGNPGP